MKRTRWLFNGLALALLWLFVRGVELTPVRLAEEFVIGLVVGMPLAYGARRFYAPTTPFTSNVRVVPYALLYLVVFFRDLLVANLSVAKLVLSPAMPIEPSVVEVPLRVRSDVAITTIANSITLTPGTLTMDYDDETNTLYVHSIAAPTREAVVDPIRTWEDYALVIFDEELKPGDPVPQVAGEPASAAGAAEGGEADGE